VTDLHLLVRYLKRHISDDIFSLLVANDVPLTGPTGLRRWLAERDLEYFAKAYFSEEFSLPLADIHKVFVADIEDIRRRALAGEPGLKVARAIPRGHSKTSWYSRLMPLHGLLYGWSPLTVLLGNNATAARRLLRNIREVCETNEALAEDFGAIPGEVWGEERLEHGSAAIVCFGVGSGAVRGVSKPGQRPSLIVGDDLDDDASVRSAIQLESNTEWWDKAIMALGDNVTFTTSYAVVGTIIRSTSLMQHILDAGDFQATIEQGVKRFADRGDLWEQWREWYIEQAKQGTKPTTPAEDAFYQEHREEMLEGTEVLWDRPDAYYQMMLYRLSRGEPAFFSEIQNQPSEAGGNLGKLPLVKLPDDLSEWNLVASLDPTTKGGKTNDKSAWIEAYFHRRRKEIIFTFCDARQRPASQTVDFVVNRLRKSNTTKRYDGLWIEANSAGTLIADSIDQRAQAENLNYNVIQVQNSAPKDERINILSVYVARGQVFASENVDPEFIAEWDGYPSYRFDDALDAAATIVQQLQKAGLLDLV
jgi:hypothetical protein